VVLLLDMSASGSLGSGSQTKREMAAEIASVLAFSALKNNDRVGLILFTNEVEKFVPPRKGRAHVFRIIREILFYRPQKEGTSLQAALHYLNQVFSRRAVVFILSDFLDQNYEQALKVAAVRHDLIAISIYDARERELPRVGWVCLEDAESGEIIEVNTSDPKIRTAFAERSANRTKALHNSLRRAGTDFLEVATSSPYHLKLRAFFDQRAARKKR
jgi:uncharacterized protein (DUF58 family)